MRHVRELIHRSLDEELAPAERARLDAHVATCASCSALSLELRRNDALLSRRDPLPTIPPSPRVRRAHPLRFVPRAGFAVAVLLFALVLGSTLRETRQNAATTPTPGASAAAVAASASGPAATAGVSATPIPLPTFVQLSVASEDVLWAWVAGSRLFRSLDRGNNWEERSAPVAPGTVGSDMSFISEGEGWLLASGSPGACPLQDVRLWQTTDGARTWRELAPSGLRTPTCKSAVSFVDGRRGYISAYDVVHGPTIYSTEDGGVTWRASAPFASGQPVCTAAAGGPCVASRVRVVDQRLLVEVTGQPSGRITRAVFTSTDGGISWSLLADVPNPQGALAIVTASRWLEVGFSDRETTDSGRTWRPFAASTWTQAAPVPAAMDFASGRIGYATVRGVIRRTSDGGATWDQLRTPGTTP